MFFIYFLLVIILLGFFNLTGIVFSRFSKNRTAAKGWTYFFSNSFKFILRSYLSGLVDLTG